LYSRKLAILRSSSPGSIRAASSPVATQTRVPPHRMGFDLERGVEENRGMTNHEEDDIVREKT
jgi:hypothetical protein